jgi:hypothetical protein
MIAILIWVIQLKKIASTISTLQANEIAIATILSAKRRLTEQANQKRKSVKIQKKIERG